MNNINIALAYINETDNPLKVFCNLFIYLLHKAKNQTLRIDEVQDAFINEFGLKIPRHIIKACARILKNQTEIQILNNGAGYKFLETTFDVDKFTEDLAQRQIREENLIDDVQKYLSEVGVEISVDDTRNCFVDFLIGSNYAYNLFENGSTVGFKSDEKRISKEWYMSQYIKKIENSNPVQFSYILDIVQGLMIYVGLCQFSDYSQDKEEKFAGTCFFFDTKLMLRYLGYSWPELVQETGELADLIRKDYKGKICIFQHTFLEIASALSNEIHALEYGEDENYELECFRKINSYRKDKFKLDLQKLESRIVDEEKIEIVENVDTTSDTNKKYNINSQKMIDYICSCYPKWKRNTVSNDVDSINQINILRRGNYNTKFGGKKKLPIFVTTNYPLITCCKKFFRQQYKEEGKEFVFDNLPIIADSALMYRLWLPKAAKIADNMPALSLARIVHTAQQENEIFYQKFKEGIKDFKEYANITFDDLSETYSSKLFEITAKNADGNYENFTEQVLAQSLEEFVIIQTDAKDKEILALQAKVEDVTHINDSREKDLINAYIKNYTTNVPLTCKVLKYLSKYWWILSAILIVGITQALNIWTANGSTGTTIGSVILGGVLLLKPYLTKILDKALNRQTDFISQYLIKCAQTKFINYFDKKASGNEKVYRDAIIKESFEILKIQSKVSK